jgi:cytochrome P450
VTERDFGAVDYFRDEALVVDPHPYYDYLRALCPVQREPHHNVVVVTGYDEASAAFADGRNLSSCIAPNGPIPGFPVPVEGRDDVAELIEEHRGRLPLNREIMTLDPPTHRQHRALMMRQLTPKRVSEIEALMHQLADTEIDQFIGKRVCNLIDDFAAPYALMNICVLLGVPEDDHAEFRVEMLGEHRDRGLGSVKKEMGVDPFAFLRERFTRYVEDRRKEPRDDVLTRMAQAPFSDGSVPEVEDVVRLATALFIGGSGTTAHLLGSAFARIAEDRELQDRLRDEPSLTPNFVEEVLRLEGPVKATFRLAKTHTAIGGVDVPAGATIMLGCAAAGRDERQFERPHELDLERLNARQHLSFGFGSHHCPGASLARAEARVGIERLLQRLDEVRIDESMHGPADARTFTYLPTYQLRGLTALHLTFTPA